MCLAGCGSFDAWHLRALYSSPTDFHYSEDCLSAYASSPSVFNKRSLPFGLGVRRRRVVGPSTMSHKCFKNYLVYF